MWSSTTSGDYSNVTVYNNGQCTHKLKSNVYGVIPVIELAESDWVDPEPEPVDPEPVDPDPVDPEPVDPEPVDPEPVDPDPVDPEPVDPVIPEPGPKEEPEPKEEGPHMFNTKEPLRVVKGTQAKTDAHTGLAGEIVFDTDRKALVAFDGTKVGGYPHALDADVVKLTGDQTVAGAKTFTGGVKMPLAVANAASLTGPQLLEALQTVDGGLGVNVRLLLALLSGDSTLFGDYLPLTGGTLSDVLHCNIPAGTSTAISIISPDFDTNTLSGTALTEQIVFCNTEGTHITRVGSFMGVTGAITAFLQARQPSGISAQIYSCVNKDGTAFLGSIYNAAYAELGDSAIVKKKDIQDNFVAKSGNSIIIDGSLKTKTSAIDIAASTSNIINGHGLFFLDSKDVQIGSVIPQHLVIGEGCCSINTSNKNGAYSQITVRNPTDATANNTGYATAPNSSYDTLPNNGIITKMVLKSSTVKRADSLYLYVGGANASDTANLGDGRGFTADMPFATIMAAYTWAYLNCHAHFLYIVLQSNQEISASFEVSSHVFSRVVIGSANQNNPVTITFTKDCYIWGGEFQFRAVNLVFESNVSLVANGIENFAVFYFYGVMNIIMNGGYLAAFGPLGVLSFISTLNLTVGGSSHTDNGLIHVSTGGTAIFSRSCSISGSITGKRYSCFYGGRIITSGRGVNFIPGTTAGTCDIASGSFYN